MKTNLFRLAVWCFLTALSTMTMAQKKSFTLEDLNFGGKNYRAMQPKNENYGWWGDQLVRIENNTCTILNPAKLTESGTISLSDINGCLDESDQVGYLFGAEFPYPDSTLVMLNNGKKSLLNDRLVPRPLYDMHALGDVVGGGVRYNFSPSFSVEVSVNYGTNPAQRESARDVYHSWR